MMTALGGGMKILIATSGSRGDVQPWIVLGQHLKNAGCEVCVFTNEANRRMVEGFGLTHASNCMDFKAFFTGAKAAEDSAKNNFLAFLQGFGNVSKECGPRNYEAYYKLIESFQPELIIAGSLHWADGVIIPILLRVPVLVSSVSVSFTDHAKAPFGLPSLPFKLNGPLHKLVRLQYLKDLKESIGKTLEDLSGKPAACFFPTHDEFLSLNKEVDLLPHVPMMVLDNPPAQIINPAQHKVVYTGALAFTASEEEYVEDFGGPKAKELERFISRWPTPPVYIGWGSVVVNTPKWMTLYAVRTLRLVGTAGVVLGGWAGLNLEHLEGEEDTVQLKAFCEQRVFFADTAAHEALFPKCSVIVHHGGVGTTNASLRSGRPTIITPVVFDQFQSADVVNKADVGIGTKHICQVPPQELADHIRTCLQDGTKISNAAAMGDRLRVMNGAGEAMKVINTFMQDSVRTGKYWKLMDELAATKSARTSSRFSWCTCGPPKKATS